MTDANLTCVWHLRRVVVQAVERLTPRAVRTFSVKFCNPPARPRTGRRRYKAVYTREHFTGD